MNKRMLTKPVRGRLSERGGLIQPSWGPLVLPTFVLGQAEYIPHSVRHSSLLTFERGLTAPFFFRVISKVKNVACFPPFKQRGAGFPSARAPFFIQFLHKVLHDQFKRLHFVVLPSFTDHCISEGFQKIGKVSQTGAP